MWQLTYLDESHNNVKGGPIYSLSLPPQLVSLSLLVADILYNRLEASHLTPLYISYTYETIVHLMLSTVHVGVSFDPVVYNISEGEMVMLRVILNTTTDQTIGVNLLTRDGSAIGELNLALLPVC